MIEAPLNATRRRIASPDWADDIFRLPAPVGPEFDELAVDTPVAEWSQARRDTMAALRAIKPRHKLAVLCVARNEAPHLAEWIAHYLAIGAEKIFVYTNDNTDGTDELLRWAATCTPVVPIFSSAAPGVNIQHRNYAHALLLLPELRLYEWVLVVDADEFLIPGAQFDYRLPTMLAAAPAETHAILFPWRWRLYDRGFERKPGLLAENYPHATPHCLFKTVTRLRHIISLQDVHFPHLEPGCTIRDTAFAPVDLAAIWGKAHKTDAGGWIDHYWGKSFEEFLVKMRRGDHLGPDGIRNYDQFFGWTGQPQTGNLSLEPEPVLASMKRELARLEAKPGYRELRARLESRYAEYAARVRNDPELQRIHQEYLRKYPSPAAAARTLACGGTVAP